MTEASPSIFLSHTGADKPFARRLGVELRASGAKVWIDEAEIKLGDSLIEKIGEGIGSCDYLGVILSPDSVVSEWVRREVEIAMNREIKGKRVVVLPLLFRDCELPPFVAGKLYADFRTQDLFYTGLNLIKERLGLQITPDSLKEDHATEDLLHQLKSPINHASRRLERMLRSVGVDSSIYRELQSISATLTRSRISLSRFRVLQAFAQGQYHSRPFLNEPLAPLVTELVAQFRPNVDPTRSLDLRLNYTRNPIATFDPGLLEVAIANLLDNAIKYSFENTAISVSLSETAYTVTVSVRNHGLPITPDDERYIFERGFRSRHAMMVTGEGSGLGLYLASRIMQLHGGELKYERGSKEHEHIFALEWPREYSTPTAA
jgi:signal transduction histidine kinase